MNLLSKLSVSALALSVVACAGEETPPTAPEAVVAAEPAAEPAAVEAEAPEVMSEDVLAFDIGEISALALTDGQFTMPVDQSPFGAQPLEDVVEALDDAGLESDTLSLSLHPMLLEGTILFDTGTGGPPAGGLMTSLSDAGVEPADITDIFISHSHFDHVGGLITSDGEPAFPNATVRMSVEEWDFMQTNEEQAAIVAAVSPMVETFEAGTADILPGITSLDTHGHTPGHSGFRITSGEETLLYVGDSMHHFVLSVGHPGWTIAFDMNEPVARESREALLAELAETGETIFAYHFPFPGIGHIETSDDGFVFVED